MLPTQTFQRSRLDGRRGFAWWKDACNLERHRCRGLGNVSLHTLPTALAYEMKRPSVELFGKIRNPAG